MCVLFLLLLLSATPALCQDVKVAGQRSHDSIKVVISEGCVAQADAADGTAGGKELLLSPGSPLVLTHQIRLVPSGSGSGSCSCEGDLAALRERIERLEREVSALREKCGDPESPGCCASSESKGPGCSIKPDPPLCPNDCSDQGRCVDGHCQCFPGFKGADCAEEECPVDCSPRGRCVDGKCQCDPGFTGPDCSQSSCPDNCSNRGRCVDGKCICNAGFVGENCTDKTCPGNCNNRGRCVDGKCVCEPGFAGENCADKTCPANCNNRGRCVNGKCICEAGFGGENCADKTCPRNCNSRGRCVNGKCVCEAGFGGENCADKTCPRNCNSRGRCVNGKCVCEAGFGGENCADKTCPGNCNSRGRCVNGKCVCEAGFGGENCADKTCPGNCNSRGRCVNGKCVCEAGFGGENCADKTCPGNCNSRGRCVNGKCVCEAGFGGENCADKTCPRNCNSRGRCVNGKCICNAGFGGENCAEKKCPGNCSNRGRCVNGKCVCGAGFGGENCADKTCPGNCNSRGRCVNGKCVCEVGFSGLDCSSKICPDDCGGHGVCVDGKCVCNSGFGGENCADKTCPGNCNSRGRCVDGKCVCNSGFKGEDCAEKACPNNCSGRGKCVNGQCVCEAGFTGADCSAKRCPGNCNNKGRCIKGKCVCRKGFSGADCGQCQDGLTGPNCDTAMSAVEQLQTKDLTQSSVTVVWTQPPVQYESYLLVFTSQKDSAEVQAEVPGSDSSFTQAGLAPGQSYTVTVTGRTGQSRGAPGSTRFSTLPAGPSDLRVVKTSTSSAVVQWEPSPSDVDRYRLTVSRGDGAGRSRELTFEAGASSAHITQLEAGVRYDLILVAEKGRSQSEPVTTHATPGPRNDSVAALTVLTSSDDKRNLSVEKVFKWTAKPGNVTKVIRRIQVWASPTDDGTSPFQSKREKYQTTESGTDLESERKMIPKEGSAGIDLTTPAPRRMCLNRVKVSHKGLGLKEKTNGCTDDGTAERASDAKESELEPSQVNQQNKDLEISQDHNLAQFHPLEKLLTETFNNLSVTTFAVNVSEPSSIDAKAEKVAQDIMQGLKLISPLKKSIAFSQYSEKPEITSSSSERSPIPTSHISVLINSAASKLRENDETKVENLDDSRTENERKVPSEGGSPVFRRTSANRTTIRRLRPNAGAIWKKTGLISRTGDTSLPSSSQMKLTSTDGPMLAEEQSSSSDENVIDGVSEGAKTKQATVPGSERPNLPNVGPFRNQTHSNSRLFRRPMRPLNGKLQTPKPHDEVEGVTSDEPLSKTEKVQEKEKVSLARATFNRSRLAFPRRPYVGPFQNRTRLLFRPPQRGPLRKNWTAESLQNGQRNRPSNSEVQERAEGGTDANIQAFFENHNTNSDNVPRFSENLEHKLTLSKFSEEGDLSIDNNNKSNDKSLQVNQESTIIRRIGQARHLKGLDTGESESGKDDVEIVSQRIKHEQDEKDRKIRLGENDDQTMPKDEIRIVENKDPTDMNQDDSSVTSDIGRDIPQDLVKQERNNSSSNSTTNQSDEQDEIISIKTEEKPAGVDPKQGNSSATVFRRRFKPGVKPIGRIQAKIAPRNRLNKEGLEAPEMNYQNAVATREQQDTGTESEEGHKPENELDSPREEGLSKDQRGEPNRTVIRRPRPNLWQFRNKTVLSPRRGNGALSTSGKVKPTSTETPIVAAEDPPSSDRKAATVNFGKAFEEERLSDDEAEVLRNAGESKSPAGSLSLDKVLSESDYKVTVLGKGSRVLSRLHKLVISTGPEPPSDLVFDHVTEDSVTVSWTKPKSAVSGFKVTYTHLEEGEPVSVTLDQGNSSVDLTRLSPGSTYEVSVLSVLGLDESDLISKTLHTLPDPPTDLRAVNVTDSGALLLWRPALATVEKYTIVYGSGTGSEVRVTVSGNTAEEQLKDLEPSTTYSVTISSHLDTRKSKEATTSFTTTASGSDGAGDLRATDVMPRTAMLSWKPPSRPVAGYKLIYWTEGHRKELSVSTTVTRLNLTRLFPGAEYFVELQTDGGEVLSTTFTTGSLRFPFPSDCSQEQLNGFSVSGLVDIFPLGRQGEALSVWCDLETDGGGWTVFQRRRDGSLDFFRSWKDYVRGFGDPGGEFWLGLEALHNLTTRGRMTLRVDLRDGPESVFAQYSTFEVAKKNYRLTVGGYSGTAGDSMTYHNGRNFSTKDRDPAALITRCAMSYRGGWWYKNCHEANLNGLYGISSKHQGIIWTSWKGKEVSIPFTEMKMRPTDFLPNRNYRL